MFKVAVIGSGYIAHKHFDALAKVELAELAAIVDCNVEKGEATAREKGVPFFTSIQAAKEAAGVDAAFICTPTSLHEQLVIEAAEAHCHVLCEKPVTFTVESFDRMVAACKKNGVRFMVAQVVRWEPEYTVVRDFIESGKLGQIHMIYEKRLCQHPAWSTWHRNPQVSGGGLYDLNIHDIDYLYSLFGRPESVYANGWQSSTGCWNHVCTSLRWPNKVQGCVETSLEMTGDWPFMAGLRITGDKGTLFFEMTAGANIRDGERGSRLIWYPAGEEGGIMLEPEIIDSFEFECREFFSAIAENREALITHEQNRGVLEIIQATIRSLENNEVVKL